MKKHGILWGIDIGGTKCAICSGDADGNVFDRHQIATGEFADWRGVLDALLNWGRAQLPQPDAVGISCGGPLDSRRGVILSPPNLPGWDEVPVTDYVSAAAGVPAFLQNDANACALAEWKHGAGKGCQNIVFLTFGTGMGSGLILGGRLYAGTNDYAGEIGHVRLAPDGPVGYGKAGSFEGFCSGGGLRQLARAALGDDMDARKLVELADAGDAEAAKVLAHSADMLGRGLALLVDILNPERIVIGSIFARAERWFRPGMQAALEREALPGALERCRIVPAGLGERTGDIAALTTALNGLEEDGL